MINPTLQVIQLTTPGRVLHWGLQLGAEKPRRVYIFIHGLGGGVFSRLELVSLLADKDSAVITFNNRGSGLVNGIRRLKGRQYNYSDLGGMSHEVFTDCVDDISGAVNYAKKMKVKEIFLIGHSTGCQKSVYYLSKQAKSPVKGVILLAPVSDYAAMKKDVSDNRYQKALQTARRLVRAGKPHRLLPEELWNAPIDAQRFLSLYLPDSQEEIFTYATNRPAKTLNKLKLPLLVLLAGNDEYHDRPTAEIAAWFEGTLARQKADVLEISGVGHNFSPGYQELSKLIKRWADRVVKGQH